MAAPSIPQNTQALVGKPTFIEKTIPGSNIKVTFRVQKSEDNKTVIQASVTIKKDTQVSETIPNVPMEDFPGSLSDQSFDEILRTLKERAIDYIRNKLIFLPADPLDLCKKWETENSKLYNKALRRCVKTIQKGSLSSKTVDAYLVLGNTFDRTSDYRYALLCYHKLFLVAEQMKFKEGLGLAHNGLGNLYCKLGENQRAINHYLEDLKISPGVPKKCNEIMLRAYGNLGDVYEALRDYEKAESYHRKYFDLACRLQPQDPREIAHALAKLGSLLLLRGKHQQAEHYFQTSLKKSPNMIAANGLALLCTNTGHYKKAIESLEKLLDQANPSEKSFLYSNLGSVYEGLGQHDRALEYHFMDLNIAHDIGEIESEARAYHNIGKFKIDNGEYEEGVDYCVKKALPLARSIGDRQLQAMIVGALGTVYFRFGEYEKALESHQTHLKIAIEIEDIETQGTAHSGLGNVYFALDEYELAIESYQKALAAAREDESKDAEASALYHLGRVFEWTEKYAEAIQYFQSSIKIYLTLQRENCQDNVEWQITLFESQYRSFRCLEKALQSAQKNGEALLAADSSRAKSLVHLLNRKLQLSAPLPLSINKIQELARKLQTFFVIYSCDPFDETKAWCRVISSAGDIHYFPLNLAQTSRKMPTWENGNVSTRGDEEELSGEKVQEAITEWVALTEMEAARGPDNDEIEQEQNATEIFKGWYEDFIAPIESFLPASGQRVTIIPDAFLHDIPFALFQDSQGNYLFEKYTLMMAPSIETLVRLEELDQKQAPQRAFENISVITSGQANPEYGVCELKEVKGEGDAIARLFPKSFPPIHEASVEDLKAIVTKGGYLHLACHGLASEKENKHSVFEGALVMTNRLLYAEDIASLPLNASLAVLSACHSGQGKLYREGSIGLPFALLAAGVSSVIATRWKIFDKATHLIVSEFYRHYLGQSNQAQQMRKAGKPFGPAEALREAMLFAKQRWPQFPQAWGAFFLVGLPNPSHRVQAGSPSNEATILDVKPFSWTNQTDGNQFQFLIKEGVITARVLPKNTHGEKAQTEIIFQESEIQVQMITLTQIQQGFQQDVRSFNTLTQQQKEEILTSLNQRKVRIIGKEIRILALN